MENSISLEHILKCYGQLHRITHAKHVFTNNPYLNKRFHQTRIVTNRHRILCFGLAQYYVRWSFTNCCRGKKSKSCENCSYALINIKSFKKYLFQLPHQHFASINIYLDCENIKFTERHYDWMFCSNGCQIFNCAPSAMRLLIVIK